MDSKDLPIDLEEYLVLEYILLHLDDNGFFQGAYSEIGEALSMDTAKVKYIVESKLKEKGLIEIIEESNPRKKIASFLDVIKSVYTEKPITPLASFLIDVRNRYTKFFKMLKDLSVPPANGITGLRNLFLINQSLNTYRTISYIALNNINDEIKKAVNEIKKISLLEEATLLLTPFIPVTDKSVTLEDGSKIEIALPHPYLLDSRTKFFEDRENTGLKLLDWIKDNSKINEEEKIYIIQGTVDLYFSIRMEIKIYRLLKEITKLAGVVYGK